MAVRKRYLTDRTTFCVLLIVFVFCIRNVFALFDVKLGIILPSDEKSSWSLKRVVPAIEYAVENVYLQGLLTNANITIETKDSECSETMGPLAAIDFYTEGTTNVFIGMVLHSCHSFDSLHYS